MPRFLVFVLIVSSLSFAQSQAPATKESVQTPSAPAAKPGDVPMSAPVLVIKGVCDSPAASASKALCETKLTRTQFETLWKTFNRQAGAEPVVEQPAAARKSMATA